MPAKKKSAKRKTAKTAAKRIGLYANENRFFKLFASIPAAMQGAARENFTARDGARIRCAQTGYEVRLVDVGGSSIWRVHG